MSIPVYNLALFTQRLCRNCAIAW